jgi:hypothetical protein
MALWHGNRNAAVFARFQILLGCKFADKRWVDLTGDVGMEG